MYFQGCASALYVAAQNGHLKTVKQFLLVVDMQMLKYLSPMTGKTCIEAARFNGHKNIDKLLQNAYTKHVVSADLRAQTDLDLGYSVWPINIIGCGTLLMFLRALNVR